MRRNSHLDMSAGAKHWRGMEDADLAAGLRPTEPAYDPYAPGTPDYVTRTRENEMMLPGGVLRVDYGSPAVSPS